MALSSSLTGLLPPRPRHKTFTGCWTCRRRRLKCDESRPTCKQCTSKSLKCEGYSAKLQWLRPCVDPYGQKEPRLARDQFNQRRLLPTSNVDTLEEEEIDTALEQLEKADASDFTLSKGPFSVFKLGEKSELSPLSSYDPTTMRHALSDPGWPHFVENLDWIPALPTGLALGDSGTLPEINIESLSNAGFSPNIPPLGPDEPLTTMPGDRVIGKDCDNRQILGFVEPGHGSPPSMHHLQLERLVFQPTFLTIQIRYLLSHYTQNVLPIFSILDNDETPWRNFHLPRALQCCSELEVTGTSPNSRQALLHAVLSSSAYNLQNRYLGTGQTDLEQRWQSAASHHRLLAVKCLRESAAHPQAASTNSEYKELLAAMLSMVTINVISGDTKTCSIHLKGCESLIIAHQKNRPTGKTTSHILLSPPHADRHSLDLPSIPIFDHGVTDGRTYPLSLGELQSYLEIDETDAEPFGSSCELIYGIPSNLLLLLSRTCHLLSQLEKNPSDPTTKSTSDELEDELLTWPVEPAVRRLDSSSSSSSSSSTSLLSSSNRQILHHHMLSFHQAIVILFARRVRNMHRHHVQQYVRAVVHHLQQIEHIKHSHNIKAGPVLWPAFVAASEAVSDDTRRDILRWFQAIETHGVATSRETRRKLELWWQSPGGNGSLSSSSLDKLFPAHLIMT
ncbi:hypothetical protein FE257_005388 [Aspergillus nanangensis]|uniref:Zn(2)-C6 fungal-type domain-containing protein n=1 Tax=Aspergillus nanangensis TaxID=2582783 RepID=A0AAD4GVH1_ASPNN|nr:hypothetical protein FE257_005388 [Aspergillus nanangensis]